MRLWILPLTVTAACGFNAPSGVGMSSDAAIDTASGDDDAMTDGSTDGAVDGSMPDTSMSGCVGSGTMDTFQGNTPCDPWATTDSNGATTSQSGGKLHIAGPAAATGMTHGGCFAMNLSPFGPEGVFIEVDQTMSGGYTALNAYVASGTPSTIVVENNVIYLRVPGSTAMVSKVYDPTQMRWWRLRPVTGGIVGETSPDALTWNLLGMVSGTPPTTIRIDISAGTMGIVTGAGTAIFDNLDVCP